MKFIFNILGLLIIWVVTYICTLNSKIFFDFTLWSIKDQPITFYNTALFQVIAFAFMLGILAGIFFEFAFYIQSLKKIKEYQRKLEKTVVKSDTDSSKVDILEAKIKTLETALQSALENKNDD